MTGSVATPSRGTGDICLRSAMRRGGDDRTSCHRPFPDCSGLSQPRLQRVFHAVAQRLLRRTAKSSAKDFSRHRYNCNSPARRRPLPGAASASLLGHEAEAYSRSRRRRPQCCLDTLCIQMSIIEDRSIGFSHSVIHGSKLFYQLPVAYRRFIRPSSPNSA
jgi:hypothetical protein